MLAQGADAESAIWYFKSIIGIKHAKRLHLPASWSAVTQMQNKSFESIFSIAVRYTLKD